MSTSAGRSDPDEVVGAFEQMVAILTRAEAALLAYESTVVKAIA